MKGCVIETYKVPLTELMQWNDYFMRAGKWEEVMPLPSNFFLVMETFGKILVTFLWKRHYSFLVSQPHEMVTFGPTPHFIALTHWDTFLRDFYIMTLCETNDKFSGVSLVAFFYCTSQEMDCISTYLNIQSLGECILKDISYQILLSKNIFFFCQGNLDLLKEIQLIV